MLRPREYVWPIPGMLGRAPNLKYAIGHTPAVVICVHNEPERRLTHMTIAIANEEWQMRQLVKLDEAKQCIRSTGGIEHDEFWRELEQG